jgi:hypothetical protein
MGGPRRSTMSIRRLPPRASLLLRRGAESLVREAGTRDAAQVAYFLLEERDHPDPAETRGPPPVAQARSDDGRVDPRPKATLLSLHETGARLSAQSSAEPDSRS